MSNLQIGILLQAAISLGLLFLCAWYRKKWAMESFLANCLYYYIKDNTGLGAKEIAEEAWRAGERHGLDSEYFVYPDELGMGGWEE